MNNRPASAGWAGRNNWRINRTADLAPGAAAASCTYLTAVGGGTSVNKTIQLNFKSTSTERGPDPIQAYLKFSDGTNLQVVNETLDAPGLFRQFGPFYPPAGKLNRQCHRLQ